MTTTEANTIPTEMISRKRAVKYLTDETDGLIFSCYFQKKDGTMREMVCRRGVAKHVTGRGMNYDPATYGYIPVYDMQHKGYRIVNSKTLVQFIVHGTLYIVKD